MNRPVTPVVLSDDQYEKFIDHWTYSFADEIALVWPNEIKAREVIVRGIYTALHVSMGVMEIYDYFSISYPGIMHNATSSRINQEKIFSIFADSMREVCEKIEGNECDEVEPGLPPPGDI